MGTAYADPSISSEGDFRFDFDADHDGRIMSGTDDAYIGYGLLYVNGSPFTAGGDEHVRAFGGRGFYSAAETLGAFEVVRSAWVPVDGGNWARYVDSFTNTSGVAEDLDVLYQGNLGSADQTVVVATSSGDQALGNDDDWVVTDDGDASGDPTLGHVIAGPGAAVSPSDVSISIAPWDFGTTTLSWQYPSIRVLPGESVSLLWFAIQEIDRATARRACEDLSLLLGRAHADLGAEGEDVVNWDFSGMPTASLEGPAELAEGTDARYVGSGSDPEGRALTLSWDLDDDDRYELLSDDIAWSAAELDGPEVRTVRLLVTSDVPEMDSIALGVVVTNVPPTTPVLVAPADGAVQPGPTIELATTVAEDVAADDVTYRLEIHGNADYTDLLRVVPIVGAVAADGVIRIDLDLENGEYWWRVRATDDDGGESGWMTASFTLGDSPEPSDAGPSSSDAGTDTDSDVDSDVDTDTDADTDGPPPKDDIGCGCVSASSDGGSGAGALLSFALLAGFARRRRNFTRLEARHA